MSLINKYGSWACVAGAGEGLGYAFAEGLAKRGFNLIIVDQKLNLLEGAEKKLRSTYQIEVEVLHLDLNLRTSINPIVKTCEKNQCRFLIYNAAYGPVTPFMSNTEEELDLYMNVNNRTLVHLVRHFIGAIKDQQSGILFLSSLAGFRGTQFVVPYAASKAFIWNFAEGLHYEFKESNIDFSVCCPGATDTPNFRSTEPKKTLFTSKFDNPESVAEEALKKFGKKLFIIPGAKNKFSHFILNRLLPRKIASAIHNTTMSAMYSGSFHAK